jgi:putative endonuclease
MFEVTHELVSNTIAHRAMDCLGIGTMERQPCVYILTNKPYGTLYVGVTSNLPGRLWLHKSKALDGFTKKYNVVQLVWYESHETMESAILREKEIKKWKRSWKIQLIKSLNPLWRDLNSEIS